SSNLPNTQPIITMDPASRLVQLRQDNRSIEEYVIDFCELCYLVNFKENFALLLGGSAFTVGITDSGPCEPPVFTKPEAVHVMPTTQKLHRTTSAAARPAHITSAAQRPAHVTSTAPRPAHGTSVAPRPAHSIPAHAIPAHAMPAHAKPAAPRPAHAKPAAPGPAH
ncbi:hypothetical protein M9458_029889, partial [Cirrhinus mrigala]